MNPIIQCKLCKEEIKKNAIVCVHCGSYQNWKRYLNFSSILLSLVIAGFTVFGFTYPYLKEKLQPPKTELKATLMGTSKDYLYLLVSNTGNRPGSIKDIYFTDYGVSKELKRPGRSLNFLSISLVEFEIIKPSESQIIKISIKNAPLVFPEYLDDAKLNKYKSVCRLRIDAVAFDGSLTEEINIFYTCIPHKLKKQWLMDKATVGIMTKQVNLENILKHRPKLYKLFKEAEERHKHNHNNEDCKNNRPCHLANGIKYDGSAGDRTIVLFRHMPGDVLRYHDGRIYNHADGNGEAPKAHEI